MDPSPAFISHQGDPWLYYAHPLTPWLCWGALFGVTRLLPLWPWLATGLSLLAVLGLVCTTASYVSRARRKVCPQCLHEALRTDTQCVYCGFGASPCG